MPCPLRLIHPPTYPTSIHSFNVSVDQANYVSLRAFLGTKPLDKLQDLIQDDVDGDLPSVEQFLKQLGAGTFIFPPTRPPNHVVPEQKLSPKSSSLFPPTHPPTHLTHPSLSLRWNQGGGRSRRWRRPRRRRRTPARPPAQAQCASTHPPTHPPNSFYQVESRRQWRSEQAGGRQQATNTPTSANSMCTPRTNELTSTGTCTRTAPLAS